VNNHPEVEVHGNIRWRNGFNHKNIESIKNKIILHESDMSDLPSLIRIFREIKPTKIFNMASHANVKVCFDTPIAVLNNNIGLMAHLFIDPTCGDILSKINSKSEHNVNHIAVQNIKDHGKNLLWD
jgi:UDP-glucose 4-epimerase